MSAGGPDLAEQERRLRALQISLKEPVRPAGTYRTSVRVGTWLYVSGQVPWRDGRLLATGRLGDSVAIDRGYECARQCATNALAAIAAEIGDLSAVARIVKSTVFIASADNFSNHVEVADGASDLLKEVFGDAGLSARSAVGVASLPLGAPVELELQVQLREMVEIPRR
ncbi:RidA family protein [Pseudonocardia alni]|uniref:RidA family protein n=1 Tax=Pseudonocardia alni TaxID=33907 RepID=UPI00280B2CDC|nr:RidA family protein [Pseudonocardia alni]